MSFCIRPSVCKKCGKPLTLFEGWHCLECEAKGHTSDELCAIRAEIEEERKGYPPSADEYKTVNKVLDIINKHIGGKE